MFSILDTCFNVVFIFPDTYYISCAVNVYIYIYVHSIWLCILCTFCMICIVHCICVYVVFNNLPIIYIYIYIDCHLFFSLCVETALSR